MAPSEDYICPANCDQEETVLVGGRGHKFSCRTPVCPAAIYAGVVVVRIQPLILKFNAEKSLKT